MTLRSPAAGAVSAMLPLSHRESEPKAIEGTESAQSGDGNRQIMQRDACDDTGIASLEVVSATTGNVGREKDETDGFQVVTNRRRRVIDERTNPQSASTAGKKERRSRGNVIVGSCEDVDVGIVAVSSVRRHWYYVSRFPPDISEDAVRDYLNRKFNLDDCVCEKVTPRNIVNRTFSSFKIGIAAHKSDLLLSPSMWPKGIELSRWRFFNKK